jgi:hypothetical protein
MQAIQILRPQDPQRAAAEELIARIFHDRYGATISTFPRLLIAGFGLDGQPLCAAGLRFAEDGFFSEQYLDCPVEEAISRSHGIAVERGRVFEVTSLASLVQTQTGSFIKAIIRHGQATGHDWSFFTLTHLFCRRLLQIGLLPTYLARAERHRISGAEAWGSYYDHAPAVFAVRNPSHLTTPAATKGTEHAISL